MPGISVFAAETDLDAQRLSSSLKQAYVHLRRGTPGPLRPPVDTMDSLWSDVEQAGVEHALACAAIGSGETVRRRLTAFLEETKADELIVTSQIFDHAARLRSFEIVAEVRDSLTPGASKRA